MIHVITFINSIPDDVRMVIIPVIKIVAHLLGLPLWEDGSVG